MVKKNTKFPSELYKSAFHKHIQENSDFALCGDGIYVNKKCIRLIRKNNTYKKSSLCFVDGNELIVNSSDIYGKLIPEPKKPIHTTKIIVSLPMNKVHLFFGAKEPNPVYEKIDISKSTINFQFPIGAKKEIAYKEINSMCAHIWEHEYNLSWNNNEVYGHIFHLPYGEKFHYNVKNAELVKIDDFTIEYE